MNKNIIVNQRFGKKSMVLSVPIFVVLTVIFLFLVAYHYHNKEKLAKIDVNSFDGLEKINHNEKMLINHLNRVIDDCLNDFSFTNKQELILNCKNELLHYKGMNGIYPYPLVEFIQIEEQLTEENIDIMEHKVMFNFEIIFNEIEYINNKKSAGFTYNRQLLIEKTI